MAWNCWFSRSTCYKLLCTCQLVFFCFDGFMLVGYLFIAGIYFCQAISFIHCSEISDPDFGLGINDLSGTCTRYSFQLQYNPFITLANIINVAFVFTFFN